MSDGGDSFKDVEELQEAQAQLQEIESELQRLSLSAVEPAMRDSLMAKLRQVRLELFERQEALEETESVETYSKFRRPRRRPTSAHFSSDSRASKIHNIRHTASGFDYEPVLKQQKQGPPRVRPRSAASSASRKTFNPPAQSEDIEHGGRTTIPMDMMKFVDTSRPSSAVSRKSRRSGDARNRIHNSCFSALPASRPSPGPAEYYPDYKVAATKKKMPISSFGREGRMKHLAGESAFQTEGRLGPGPKYKPSVVHTKTRHSVTSIGRENRLGSSVAP